MKETWDVVVVGAGMVGLAVAYELSRRNLRVALLDKGGLGQGASAANCGLVLASDAEPGLSRDLTLEGFRLLSTLSARLGYDFEFEQKTFLQALISETELAEAEEMLNGPLSKPLHFRLLTPEESRRYEPYLDTKDALAVFHSLQAVVNPLQLLFAYYRAARRQGVTWFPKTEVRGFSDYGNAQVAVQTERGEFKARKVIVAAGAWSAKLLSPLPVELPMAFIQGEAMVTEALPSLLSCCTGLFTSDRIDLEKALGADLLAGKQSGLEETSCLELDVRQMQGGNLLIGQKTDYNSAYRDTVSWNGMGLMAGQVLRWFPTLRAVRVLRTWVSPVAFTPDHQPLLGPLPHFENIFLATGFKSTIVLTPIVAELAADWACDANMPYDLGEFRPARFGEE
ncbi:FAD dependent oxidoreductase [Acididesulfobacillus acetoxydans]|uniref:FAD dependent oxidoreductase n=1 Tax=Acididesulfobacillus acetoxydans TaxID=1561005 RepID=A0A8S0WN50_9FIRM|nr:FAD-dependent oxidoreductase [Acididesulfobacillus acetoxydans]CAA7601044.1 FAD dependent oxidoreductase [Acididesulfobacillus acetoxydans]CEJ06918.1 Oleate hydratase [Acididesulfobacillus acetoxydans]